VGDLTMVNSSHIIASKEDFELIDKDRKVIFEFIDHNLGVSQQLFLTISDLFNMNVSETENIFVRWFEKKYPNELIMASYCSVYY
jgi:glutamine phosphoribosylpyrophosphate amidotransferase